MKTPFAKCDRCGVEITSVTHRVNCGYCMVCGGVSSDDFYLPKTLRGPADAVAVAAELAQREDWLLLHHWTRVLLHLEPGDELLQFSCEEPYGWSSFLISHGVLWRRAGELLSVITLDVERESWRKVEADFEELKVTRFATAEELAACAPIRAAWCPGDRVVYYKNADIRHIPACIPAAFFERHWDMLLTEGRTGLMLIRNWECVLSVRLGEPWPSSIAVERGW